MKYALAALAGLSALLVGCSSQPSEADRYLDECQARGGFVSREGDGWAVKSIECVGQTSGPQMPKLGL